MDIKRALKWVVLTAVLAVSALLVPGVATAHGIAGLAAPSPGRSNVLVPVPDCGDTIGVTLVSRTNFSTTVKVVAVDMARWLLANEPYAVLRVSAGGQTDGPYHPARSGGSSGAYKPSFIGSQHSIYVSVSNTSDTQTKCQTTGSV